MWCFWWKPNDFFLQCSFIIYLTSHTEEQVSGICCGMSTLGDSAVQSHGWNDLVFVIVILLSQGWRRDLQRSLPANIFRLHRSSNKNSYYFALHLWLAHLLILGGEKEMHSLSGCIAVGKIKLLANWKLKVVWGVIVCLFWPCYHFWFYD